MKRTLFIDVDGTLIDYHTNTPESAKKAINMARNNGHVVFLCTGCSMYELSKRDLPEVDGVIGGNGTYIEYHSKVLFHNFLKYNDVKDIVDWLNTRRIGFYLESNNGMFCNKYMLEQGPDTFIKYALGKGKSLDDSASRTNDFIKDMTLLESKDLYRDDVNKISYILPFFDFHQEFKKKFNYLNNGTWGGKDRDSLFGDVTINDIDKGEAVKKVLQLLGISKEDSIAFGDSDVDLTMFDVCEYSIAMGNSKDIVKKKASYITNDVDDDGLYKAFKKLELL